MSLLPATEPACSTSVEAVVSHVIDARQRSIGDFTVRRVLPSMARRMVGPFIFFDHMGPVRLAAGEGMDVPPHPHIGLATVTYLFTGEIVHRDSLGSLQTIRPGDINWMTAGRGIVHSERTDPALRAVGPEVHGLQLWVALPTAHEAGAPSFHHHEAASLPELEQGGVRLRVLAGSAYGRTSPVKTLSPLFYVAAELPAGSKLRLPDEHAERAAYIVEGGLGCGTERAGEGRMLVFHPGQAVELHAEVATRLVLIGGARLDGTRYIDWNFVSSDKARIEEAKQAWREDRFPKVPGDELERVPLP